MENWRKSVVLITSQDTERQENGMFGTGFVIHQEQSITYILTCAHVVEDVGGKEEVVVAGKKAIVKTLGDSQGCDLALLTVKEGLSDLPILKLGKVEVTEKDFTIAISICGFYTDATRTYKQAKIQGKGDEGPYIFNPKNRENTKTWNLKINDILPGYSGSPIIDPGTGYVLGVVSQSTGNNQGLGISIEAWETIWQEMDLKLEEIRAQPTQKPNDTNKSIDMNGENPSDNTTRRERESPQSQVFGNITITGSGNDFKALQAGGDVTLNQNSTHA